jgi:tRNA nucleotidyltransferase (CCA-adding enzyme)
MEIYAVGGAVRDALLGLEVHDCDWVVVGASPEELLALGYLPVGKDFPVFLHPNTRQEYALARTERKTALGYKGFQFHYAPDTTLEEDLRRRDLTINAIARAADGRLIDPYGGQADLHAKSFRHVSDAFAQDPVRILRVARFAARFTDFTVAPSTNALMQSMVQAGEVDALVAERVWQELARGLNAEKPSRMFDVLRNCSALERLLPELNRLWGVPQPAEHHPEIDTGVHVMMVLDYAAAQGYSLGVRFACLMHDLGKGTTASELLPRHLGHEGRSVQLLEQICQRLRVPKDIAELAQVVAREHGNVHRSLTLNAAAILRLLERCDALRKPERFEQALQACECDARGRLGKQHEAYPQKARLLSCLQAARNVVAGPIVNALPVDQRQAEQIKKSLAHAREQAIANAMHLPLA